MLLEIYINNFILIEELRMQFSSGLNVLSGETGAGKSIIVDALGLLMGDRVSYDDIRDENKKAIIEAIFDLNGNQEACAFLQEQDLLEEDLTLVISREIVPQGRTVARINGRAVTATVLRKLSVLLIDLHGQEDRQNILTPSMYLQSVDSFIPYVEGYLSSLSQLYASWKVAKKKLEALQADAREGVQRTELLAYEIKEIEDANLFLGEDEELELLRERIKNAQSLLEGSSKLLTVLYSSEESIAACDLIYTAMDTARELKGDTFFSEMLAPLEEIYYQIQDFSEKISVYKDSLDFEPGLLEQTEDRIYSITKLKKKYGTSISSIFIHLENARREWEELDLSTEKLEALQQEINQMEVAYLKEARELNELRSKAAQEVENRVRQELQDLSMPHIRFEIAITATEAPGPSGMDEIEFLFSPNPGEALHPLAKIASGGEVSRFILALKTALAEVYHVPTLIFDEIDAGLGGSALTAMAKKISALSNSHQILLITHAPQISSYAEQHFVIEKQVRDDRTFTQVRLLKQEEQVIEIARMLDGENYSQMTIDHAREMLKKAHL